ncbi:hypothetical protein BDW74DRAFT_181071 [Aspergillus multicolor]|uniref:uncharacterized protein n=1 Tax=Aspergillus multicolor TaxID=41759 RepID=UPI003CCD24B5
MAFVAAIPLAQFAAAAIGTVLFDTAFVVTSGFVIASGIQGLCKPMSATAAAQAAAKAAAAAEAAAEATTASASASVYTAVTAAGTAAAPITTTATATGTATATATASTTITSTASWLWALATSPAGITAGCVLVAGGLAWYYWRRPFKSKSKSKSNKKPPPPSTPTPSDPNGSEPPPGFNKPILIPINEFRKLLESRGKKIYEALTTKSSPGKTRTIWSDDNYRIDLGHVVHGEPRLKTWHLQVQRQAKSAMAWSLRSKIGTHEKLF